ncbi:clavaminate synthase (plasmid) [Azospirillum argentinense]|uniref:Clavaminate synthase n=1 Tax=Azospirillum argentinense TaxID=2970906 RepID=A0A4D8PSG2_9PROT|nr:TauD/TfdA family dioxygenase [Azospirillum argentinense]QCO00275.1 clavaminate synthase [Azospirillum argentinense]
MDQISKFALDAQEAARIDHLMGEVARECASVEDETFLGAIGDLKGALPGRLRDALRRFADEKDHAVCVVSGFPVEEIVAPTPRHWREVRLPRSRFDYFFVLASSVVGDVFGFSDLQDGRLMQEIFPIRDDARKQLGTGSVYLALHTEDTALDYRADYLGFSCGRNVDRIPTDVAIPDFGRLALSTVRALQSPSFKTFKDRPVLEDGARGDAYSVGPILFKYAGRLGMRYDPLYMDFSELSPTDAAAINDLVALVEASVVPVCLQPGEIAFIDNNRCAHGRKGFEPRYDGTDRWLKRIQISNRLDRYRHACLPGRWNVLP